MFALYLINTKANSSYRYQPGDAQWHTQYVFSYGVVQTRHENYKHSHSIHVSRKLIKFDFLYTYIIICLLVDEALRYKPEGRGFDSRWCHWNFSLT